MIKVLLADDLELIRQSLSFVMSRQEYRFVVYNWMIRRTSALIMKSFVKLLKRVWNPVVIFSREE